MCIPDIIVNVQRRRKLTDLKVHVECQYDQPFSSIPKYQKERGYKLHNIKQCGLALTNGIGKDQEILLVLQEESNKWGIPKGHKEKNETLIACAERETYEETGIDVQMHKVARHGTVSCQGRTLIFVVQILQTNFRKNWVHRGSDNEIRNSMWIPVRDLVDFVNPVTCNQTLMDLKNVLLLNQDDKICE